MNTKMKEVNEELETDEPRWCSTCEQWECECDPYPTPLKKEMTEHDCRECGEHFSTCVCDDYTEEQRVIDVRLAAELQETINKVNAVYKPTGRPVSVSKFHRDWKALWKH